MKAGYEDVNKEEFFSFLNWYKEKKENLAESKFENKIQYKNENFERIAYYVTNENRYMIAEDIYTEYYYSNSDK